VAEVTSSKQEMRKVLKAEMVTVSTSTVAASFAVAVSIAFVTR